MMSPALASGILASALASTPGLTFAPQSRAAATQEANALFTAQRHAEANALDHQYRPASLGVAESDPILNNYFGLVKIYEDAGRIEDAEAVLQQARTAAPDRPDVWTQTAQFFNRQGRFDEAMEALEQGGRLEPGNPQAPYQLAVFYEEKVRKDYSLTRPQQITYLAKGLEAVDRALALRPDYFEALTYKNLILRQQARFETDPGARRALIDHADRLQRQAIDVRNAQARGPRLP
jgi:tetratricopeptide (TPR) repeat protein